MCIRDRPYPEADQYGQGLPTNPEVSCRTPPVPGGGVGNDEVHRRGVPLEAVGLLEVAVDPEKEGRDPGKGNPDRPGRDR
eukprot:12076304-Alexandrium_andersonii.AAC.1